MPCPGPFEFAFFLTNFFLAEPLDDGDCAHLKVGGCLAFFSMFRCLNASLRLLLSDAMGQPGLLRSPYLVN